MILRIILTIVLLAGAGAAFLLVKRGRLKNAQLAASTDPLLESVRPGLPTVLYFTTPGCMICKFAQEPALDQLKSELGDAVNIIKIDAEANVDAAQRWKIRTIPTTFVLNKAGKPVDVNMGAADADKLKSQLSFAS